MGRMKIEQQKVLEVSSPPGHLNANQGTDLPGFQVQEFKARTQRGLLKPIKNSRVQRAAGSTSTERGEVHACGCPSCDEGELVEVGGQS
jgi:hypothetical protein